MKKFVSLSQHPGKQGFYFYNSFFKLYNIDAEYFPLSVHPDNFSQKILELKNEDVSGISVSMPFKFPIIDFLDDFDSDVLEFNLCNTVLCKDKKLVGYNTDLEFVKYVATRIKSPLITILGNGSIGKMFKKFLSKFEYNINNYSPSLSNWNERHDDSEVVINCTSLGTLSKESPLNNINSKTKLIVDLAITPGELESQARENNVEYISGQELYKFQFQKQFFLYTGLQINLEDYERISKLKKI